MFLNLYEFYNLVKAQNIVFCYSGPIAQESLEGISQTLRKKLEADEVDFNAAQAIFSIFIEEIQNILNYSAERQKIPASEAGNELSSGIFVIGYVEDGYFIHCGNQIYSKDVAYITAKIEELRDLSKDGLKALYRTRRKMESDLNSKGSGLGLIEIARRAGHPMEYTFSRIDDEYSFFALHVLVGG